MRKTAATHPIAFTLGHVDWETCDAGEQPHPRRIVTAYREDLDLPLGIALLFAAPPLLTGRPQWNLTHKGFRVESAGTTASRVGTGGPDTFLTCARTN